jgi:uncharacterized protein Veg
LIAKSDLISCRDDLSNHIGTRVRLKSNGGRKRTIVHEGFLDNCSVNVFTVRCPVSATYNEFVSFSYVDLLTKTVEVTFQDSEVAEEMKDFLQIETKAAR